MDQSEIIVKMQNILRKKQIQNMNTADKTLYNNQLAMNEILDTQYTLGQISIIALLSSMDDISINEFGKILWENNEYYHRFQDEFDSLMVKYENNSK